MNIISVNFYEYQYYHGNHDLYRNQIQQYQATLLLMKMEVSKEKSTSNPHDPRSPTIYMLDPTGSTQRLTKQLANVRESYFCLDDRLYDRPEKTVKSVLAIVGCLHP
ncbi:Hypothetical predicted protein [Octopus vulgaris]|uniref:Uncharacterized protein n=1 Tax=Octopus vulgaris TaxID=6645 RepID=A0AA36B135_OCTVU|nr:Hypothetical predicted protein [Octopus vulgaris]